MNYSGQTNFLWWAFLRTFISYTAQGLAGFDLHFRKKIRIESTYTYYNHNKM